MLKVSKPAYSLLCISKSRIINRNCFFLWIDAGEDYTGKEMWYSCLYVTYTPQDGMVSEFQTGADLFWIN